METRHPRPLSGTPSPFVHTPGNNHKYIVLDPKIAVCNSHEHAVLHCGVSKIFSFMSFCGTSVPLTIDFFVFIAY